MVVINRTGDSDDSCNSQGGSNGTNAGDSWLQLSEFRCFFFMNFG